MARVPYVQREELAPEDQHLLDRPNNLQCALANHPVAMDTFMAVNRWIRFSQALDPRLREMAILQVGYSTANAYEFSHHLKLAPQFGVSETDIAALVAETAGESSGLPALDVAVLRAARDLTVDIVVTDDAWTTLSAELDTERLMDLTFAISYYNHIVRVIAAFQVEVEPDYALLLETYPPPSPFTQWR